MKVEKRSVIFTGLLFVFLCSCNTKQKKQDDCNDKATELNNTVLPYIQGQTIEYKSSDGRIISLKNTNVSFEGTVYSYSTRCETNKKASFVNDSMNLIMEYHSGTGQVNISSNVSLRGFDFGYDFDILQISDANPQGVVAPPVSYGKVNNEYLGDTTINGIVYKYVYATTVQIDSIYSDRKFNKFYLNNINGLLGMIEKNNNIKWFLK